MIITFSGLDGSGKTTLSEKSAQFVKQWGKEVKIIKFYNKQTFSLLGRIISIFSPVKAKKIAKVQFDLRSPESFQKKVIAIIRQLSLLIDILVYYLLIKIPEHFSKKIIVLDRCFLDSIVQLRYLKMCNRSFFNVFISVMPTADIQILLLDNPEHLYKRKPEYAFSYFEEKSKLYNEVSELINVHVLSEKSLSHAENKLEELLKNILTKTSHAR